MTSISQPEPLDRRLWNVVAQESSRFQTRYAAADAGLIEQLIERASYEVTDSAEEEDILVVEEKLRLILAVAARWEESVGGRRVTAGVVSEEALHFALNNLCPIWPFC